MNKQQTCGFLGWTSGELDRNVSRGFPARKVSRSRGADWQVDSREAVDWVGAEEGAKLRPRHSGKIAFSDAPPGWEPFKAVELVENPVERVAMMSVMTLLYSLPRLTA